MSVCIAYAGCQAERHRPDCAKFDQRAEDTAEIRELLDENGQDHSVLNRLLGESL